MIGLQAHPPHNRRVSLQAHPLHNRHVSLGAHRLRNLSFRPFTLCRNQ